MTKKEINDLTYQVVGAAIEVHKFLGPGLLESTYQRCMQQELFLRGIPFEAGVATELVYKGVKLSADLRCDIYLPGKMVIELKAAEAIVPVFQAQLLTYMRLLQVPKGILINFNCENIWKEGQRTMVNDLFAALPA